MDSSHARKPALGPKVGLAVSGALDTAMATAVWFPRARQVELRPERLPPIGDDEVRVRAIASGLSHGTEMLVYRGEVPPDLGLDLPTYDFWTLLKADPRDLTQRLSTARNPE